MKNIIIILTICCLLGSGPVRTSRIFVKRQFVHGGGPVWRIIEKPGEAWSIYDVNGERPWAVTRVDTQSGIRQAGLLWGNIDGKLGTVEFLPVNSGYTKKSTRWKVIKIPSSTDWTTE